MIVEHTTGYDTILVLDFGSQYNQLIVRRLREIGVYAELVPHTIDIECLKRDDVKGIILSGGPQSVNDVDAKTVDAALWNIKKPMLGICYGQQMMIQAYGGAVCSSHKREYGAVEIECVKTNDRLFSGIPNKNTVWMSHQDEVTHIPEQWECIAHSKNCRVAAVQNSDILRWGIQFHPEVTHSEYGTQVLRNFAFAICNISTTWSMHNYVNTLVEHIQKTVGTEHVICGLSGGVDSAVTAAIIEKAIGNQLYCILIDNGLLRKKEREHVETVFKPLLHNRFLVVDASEQFFTALKDVVDPEQKRKIIGNEFIKAFQRATKEITKATFLAQGTLYTDVVESGQGGSSHTIKSHHNVGGLPEHLPFTLLEPLRALFKDEARALGLELGLPNAMVYRQPFPGPGLAVRVLGNITPERVKMVRNADYILREEIESAGYDSTIWQYFAVLMGIRTVGVMGDARSYCDAIAIRAVHSVDGMTASIAHVPMSLLERISNRIVSEVQGINRIVYDITSKPPGTIEWE